MDGFSLNLVAQCTIKSPVYVDVEERQVSPRWIGCAGGHYSGGPGAFQAPVVHVATSWRCHPHKTIRGACGLHYLVISARNIPFRCQQSWEKVVMPSPFCQTAGRPGHQNWSRKMPGHVSRSRMFSQNWTRRFKASQHWTLVNSETNDEGDCHILWPKPLWS